MFNIFSRISTVSALGMAIGPGFAAAAPSGGSSETNDGQMVFTGSQNAAGSLVWVIVSLAIVITLIICVIKWLSARNRTWGANRSLRSLGGIALGQNQSLQVIEIAGKVYIVGVGDSITLIDKLPEGEEALAVIAALERKAEAAAWPQQFITELAGRLMKRKENNEAEPTGDGWNQSTTFQHMLQSKLSRQADRKQQLESLLQESKSDERLMDDEK